MLAKKEFCILFLGFVVKGLTQNVPKVPCPQYFEYKYDRSRTYGKITLPELIEDFTKLDVEFAQKTPVRSGYYGTIAIAESEADIKHGRPVSYRIEFPTPNEIPMLTKIAVNGRNLCSSIGFESSTQILELQHNLTYHPALPISDSRRNDNPEKNLREKTSLFQPINNFEGKTNNNFIRSPRRQAFPTTTAFTETSLAVGEPSAKVIVLPGESDTTKKVLEKVDPANVIIVPAKDQSLTRIVGQIATDPYPLSRLDGDSRNRQTNFKNNYPDSISEASYRNERRPLQSTNLNRKNEVASTRIMDQQNAFSWGSNAANEQLNQQGPTFTTLKDPSIILGVDQTSSVARLSNNQAAKSFTSVTRTPSYDQRTSIAPYLDPSSNYDNYYNSAPAKVLNNIRDSANRGRSSFAPTARPNYSRDRVPLKSISRSDMVEGRSSVTADEETATDSQSFRPYTADQSNFNQQNDLTCGQQTKEYTQYVFGGSTVKRGQMPWMAALYRKDMYHGLHFLCSGSLISSNAVLTAAHCVVNSFHLTPDRVVVNLGKHNLDDYTEDGVQVRELQTFISHHEYSSKNLSDADIALLILSSPVKFTKYISPVCLWEKDYIHFFPENSTAYIAGWGADEYGHQISNSPKFVEAKIIKNIDCLTFQGALNIVTPRTLCAGNENGSGPCLGDSGAGLIVSHEDKWVLRAIVSGGLKSGKPCDRQQFVVYTDLDSHIDWVKRTLPTKPFN